MCELVAEALSSKGAGLSRLGRSEEAIAIYDDLAYHFGSAREIQLRQLLATALFNKGVTLGALGRRNEEVAVYDDLIARIGATSDLRLRELLASTKSAKEKVRNVWS